MKDTNRPVTYVISIKLLIVLVILIVGGASTYAFFIKGYFSLYSDNQKLENIIRSLKTEVSTFQTTIGALKRQQTTTARKDETEEEKPVVAGIQPIVKDNGMVEIQNFSLERQAELDILSFTFFLFNVTEDGKMLRGYLFAILKNGQGRRIDTFPPEVGISDGAPADYRQGDKYAIRRFKKYGGEMKWTTDARFFDIYVYSDVGELIAQVRNPVPAD